MEARIRQLASMLESAEIVDTTDGEIVEPGATVQLRYQGDDDIDPSFYGSVEERDIEHDIISPRSPPGEALVGKKVGNEVQLESPTGPAPPLEAASIP